MAKTKTKTKPQPDPKVVAKAIHAGTETDNSWEEGGAFAAELAAELSKLGWKRATSYSECSKASYEKHLQHGTRRIEIISSSFLGVFTQITLTEA
jgi:hypothetical protein